MNCSANMFAQHSAFCFVCIFTLDRLKHLQGKLTVPFLIGSQKWSHGFTFGSRRSEPGAHSSLFGAAQLPLFY